LKAAADAGAAAVTKQSAAVLFVKLNAPDSSWLAELHPWDRWGDGGRDTAGCAARTALHVSAFRASGRRRRGRQGASARL